MRRYWVMVCAFAAITACSDEASGPTQELPPTEFFANGYVIADGQPLRDARVRPIGVNVAWAVTDSLGYYELEFKTGFCRQTFPPKLGIRASFPEYLDQWWLYSKLVYHTEGLDPDFCATPRQRVDFVFWESCQRLDCYPADGNLDGCRCGGGCIGC